MTELEQLRDDLELRDQTARDRLTALKQLYTEKEADTELILQLRNENVVLRAEIERLRALKG